MDLFYIAEFFVEILGIFGNKHFSDIVFHCFGLFLFCASHYPKFVFRWTDVDSEELNVCFRQLLRPFIEVFIVYIHFASFCSNADYGKKKIPEN